MTRSEYGVSQGAGKRWFINQKGTVRAARNSRNVVHLIPFNLIVKNSVGRFTGVGRGAPEKSPATMSHIPLSQPGACPG